MPELPAAPPYQDMEIAVARLDGLSELPLEQHVEAFDVVHRALQDALAELDGS
jgi:hypothetical protein